MPFLFVYFVWAALLLALPVAWLFAALYLAKAVRTRSHTPIGSMAIVFCFLGAPLLWLAYSYITFAASCSGVKPLHIFSQLALQKSVLLRWSLGDRLGGKDTNIDLRTLLDRTGPVCTELESTFGIIDPMTQKSYRYVHRCERDSARTNDPISGYAFSVSAEPDGTGLGFVLAYRAEAVDRTVVVAEAHEALFGRGILSQYIGLLNGSVNREYLACGYAYQTVHIWRKPAPIGSSMHAAYTTKDLQLFQIAAGRANAR